jgi:hypothetical protein
VKRTEIEGPLTEAQTPFTDAAADGAHLALSVLDGQRGPVGCICDHGWLPVMGPLRKGSLVREVVGRRACGACAEGRANAEGGLS